MECRLCHQDKEKLRDSHIVPKMFYNAIKRNSPTGIMREVNNPNKGVQDGVKLPFLCKDCEELFSKYETYFSNNIYTEICQNTGIINIDSRRDEYFYFMLSVAWRVAMYVMETDNPSFSEDEKKLVYATLAEWREWLLYEKMDKIREVQHFLIPTRDLNFFASIPVRISDNVAIDFKTFDKENEFGYAFTFVQVPYFILLSTIWGKTSSMKQFRLGKKIKNRDSVLPKNITNLLHFLHYDKYFQAYDAMSDKQREMIEKRVLNK